MYHYKTRVCLMQFLVGEEVYLVDVLAPGLKLEPLLSRLAHKHLLMHGSDFDLRLLQDLCGFGAQPASTLLIVSDPAAATALATDGPKVAALG